MIVVVADTSPLNYLVQIECQELLPALFDRILVPSAVIDELAHARTPAVVRTWAGHPPEWLKIRQVHSSSDETLAALHPGEREAIQLAQEERADLLLMDERTGVKVARQLGLEVTGTLGVLIQGARRGLVDIDAALEHLQATDFRCTPRLFELLRQRAREKP